MRSGRGHVAGINLLIPNGKSIIGSSPTCMHTHTNIHTYMNTQQQDVLSFVFGCSVSVGCCITVIEDIERDSVTTLDFPATYPD